ncbi:MAG: hypothetical protein AB1649_03780 [Chloroflexota bacterium]
MLSVVSRSLTYACAGLYAVLGALLYFLPESLATVFAWKVSPFMTMTIGGWCLGNVWLAWMSARRWDWRLVYSGLIYLWLFGILELGVLLAFNGKVNLSHPIAWLYVGTLAVNGLTAAVGIADWFRIRPARERFGAESAGWQRFAALAFVIFVGFLGLYGFIARVGWPATQGGIFPEEMSSFTLRSFAAFYFSLVVAAIPLIRERSLPVLLNHSIVNYGLIIFITAAAFIYIRLFDFAARPGGLLYFGAYLVVGIPLLFVFAKHGTGARKDGRVPNPA